MLRSPHIVIEVIVLSLMTLMAFAGLSYAWWHLRTAVVADTPLWRRSVTSIGLLGSAFKLWSLYFSGHLSFTTTYRSHTGLGG